jgi:hypothetical protein
LHGERAFRGAFFVVLPAWCCDFHHLSQRLHKVLAVADLSLGFWKGPKVIRFERAVKSDNYQRDEG